MAPIGAARVSRNSQVGDAIPDSGVFRLTFDDADTSGSTALDVWNNFDGTINGATTGVTGELAEAYDFDGVDDFVGLGDEPEFTFGDNSNDSPFSISAWINPDASTNFRIMSKGAGSTATREYLFTINGIDNLGLFLYDDGGNTEDQCRRAGDTDFSTLTGTWTHVVATYDGSSTSSGITIYVNGTEEGSYTLSADGASYVAMDDEGGSLDIGEGIDGVSYADGGIDDPRLYNKELTATEVSNLYNTGSI